MTALTTSRATQIGAVLEAVVALSRELAAPRQTPFGDAVLTRTQLDILFVLAHSAERITPGHLASLLRVTPGAITQTVDQLREQGLVEQTISDEDGRSRVLMLTASARADVAAFEAASVLRVAPWFAELTDDELDGLAASLSKVSSGA
ncbi:MarR family transcriptional regulator [Microbacterium lacus]|uniref:MarR family winged helix-turn-helix transcriptional regulator n=1 Tax=Microbacterium lacus TaxID=415217 RepID=UPI00384D6B8A